MGIQCSVRAKRWKQICLKGLTIDRVHESVSSRLSEPLSDSAAAAQQYSQYTAHNALYTVNSIITHSRVSLTSLTWRWWLIPRTLFTSPSIANPTVSASLYSGQRLTVQKRFSAVFWKLVDNPAPIAHPVRLIHSWSCYLR